MAQRAPEVVLEGIIEHVEETVATLDAREQDWLRYATVYCLAVLTRALTTPEACRDTREGGPCL